MRTVWREFGPLERVLWALAGPGGRAHSPDGYLCDHACLISMHFLLAALAGLRALLSMPTMLFSRFPTCLPAAAMLAMLSLSCGHLASGHACLRAILLCGLCDGVWDWFGDA